MTNTASHSYPKKYRLLKPNQFKAVFDKPSFKAHQPHIMGFVASNLFAHARLGLAITKKKVPTAVARNRLKRLVRERFRLQKTNLSNTDIIIIAKRPITGLTNEQLVDEIDAIIRKIVVKSIAKDTIL